MRVRPLVSKMPAPGWLRVSVDMNKNGRRRETPDNLGYLATDQNWAGRYQANSKTGVAPLHKDEQLRARISSRNFPRNWPPSSLRPEGIADLGAVSLMSVGGSAEAFEAALRRDYARWADVVKATGVKGE